MSCEGFVQSGKFNIFRYKDMLCSFYDLRLTALVFCQKQNNNRPRCIHIFIQNHRYISRPTPTHIHSKRHTYTYIYKETHRHMSRHTHTSQIRHMSQIRHISQIISVETSNCLGQCSVLDRSSCNRDWLCWDLKFSSGSAVSKHLFFICYL